MKSMRLKEIMIKNPITLNVDEPLIRVAQIFQEKDIRHLPIVNGQGILMGIISQRDLNRITSPKRAPNGDYLYDPAELTKYVLKNHTIEDVIALSPEDVLEKAVELMSANKLGCIPVIDHERKVVGILTIPDILKLFLIFLRTCSDKK